MALDGFNVYLDPYSQFLHCIQWSDSVGGYIQVWKAHSGTSNQHSSAEKYENNRRMAWLGRRTAIMSRGKIDGMIIWS